MFHRHTIIVAALFALACAAQGDTLVTRNGESFTGRLERIENGAVSFRASLAGMMLLPIDEVRSLTTERAALVRLTDDSELRGVPGIADGSLTVKRSDDSEASFGFAQIAEVLPEKKIAAESLSLSDKGPLSASAETGVLWHSGEEDYADLFTRLFLQRLGDASDFTGEFFVERADTSDFPRWLRGNLRWDLDSSRNTYPFIAIEAERDTDKALAARGDLVFGLATDTIDNPSANLVAEVGIDAETSVFDSDFPEGRETPSERLLWHSEGRRKVDRQQLNLRLGLRYRRALFNSGELTSGLYVHPSLTHWGRLRARSESALTLPFSPRLALRLNLMLDYEDDLEFGELGQWRTSVGASVLWGF